MSAGRIDVEDEDAVGVEPQRQRCQPPEGRDERSGSDEQHQRQRDLEHHEAPGTCA